MPGNYLTTASTILCPHGGTAILTTTNNSLFADGAPVLLESDVHPVVGCPFTIGPKYSPCIKIQWSMGSTQTLVNGIAPLVQTSIGLCSNPEGAPQGVAIIANSQLQVSAL